jgi:PAS domain-containing protein
MFRLFTRDVAQPPPSEENSSAGDPLVLLAAVADALPDPFLLLNRDGYVAIANRAADEIFETQLTGKHISHAVRSPVILDAVQEVIAHRDPLRVDFEQRIPLERRFEASIAPLAKSERAAGTTRDHHPVSRSHARTAARAHARRFRRQCLP